jgi:hypothetical protein
VILRERRGEFTRNHRRGTSTGLSTTQTVQYGKYWKNGSGAIRQLRRTQGELLKGRPKHRPDLVAVGARRLVGSAVEAARMESQRPQV